MNNRNIVTQDFASVQGIVDGSAVVFGVYLDPGQPDGVGLLLVKGHALLRTIVAAGEPMSVTMDGVPCSCAEQAEALRLVAGEADDLH